MPGWVKCRRQVIRKVRDDGQWAEVRWMQLRSAVLAAVCTDATAQEIAACMGKASFAGFLLCRVEAAAPAQVPMAVGALRSAWEQVSHTKPLLVSIGRTVVLCAVCRGEQSRLPNAEGALTGVHRFADMASLLAEILPLLRRCESITLYEDAASMHLDNEARFLAAAEDVAEQLATGSAGETGLILAQAEELLTAAEGLRLLRAVSSRLLTRAAALCSSPEVLSNLLAVEMETDVEQLRSHVLTRLTLMAGDAQRQDVVSQIRRQVRQHLSNPDLSLKWLAENCIFMNVDYLSKQFAKKTGEKFSAYLSRKRMERAQELLAQEGAGRICDVAAQVGCGHDPQYFSRIFRQYSGQSPTAYMRLCQARRNDRPES